LAADCPLPFRDIRGVVTVPEVITLGHVRLSPPRLVPTALGDPRNLMVSPRARAPAKGHARLRLATRHRVTAPRGTDPTRTLSVTRRTCRGADDTTTHACGMRRRQPRTPHRPMSASANGGRGGGGGGGGGADEHAGAGVVEAMVKGTAARRDGGSAAMRRASALACDEIAASSGTNASPAPPDDDFERGGPLSQAFFFFFGRMDYY
jgi:hypothetical protein